MAVRLRATSLYDVVVSAVAGRKMDSNHLLEEAKKQTVYEVLLNAMAAHKQKMVVVVEFAVKIFSHSHL